MLRTRLCMRRRPICYCEPIAKSNRPDCSQSSERPLSADFVEKVCGESGAGSTIGGCRTGPALSRRSWFWHWDELGYFPEVLGRGCKVELVTGAVRSPQSQSIELQDAFEVGEQHLD